MKGASHLLEGEMRTGAQEHFYLETHASLAVPSGEDGEMEVTLNRCLSFVNLYPSGVGLNSEPNSNSDDCCLCFGGAGKALFSEIS